MLHLMPWHMPYVLFGRPQLAIAGVEALGRRTGGLLTGLWLRLYASDKVILL